MGAAELETVLKHLEKAHLLLKESDNANTRRSADFVQESMDWIRMCLVEDKKGRRK